MEITTRIIRRWADEGGIPDLTLAELDYRLVHALQAIYTDSFLRDRLYLKGGTALNKLYLADQSRLSVDLDLNAIGTRERVLQERTQIGQALMVVLQKQDQGYDLAHHWRYDQASVQARFTPLSGTARQRLKLEISFVEWFAVLGCAERALLTSPFAEPPTIPTYHLEELLSTKLRALYDRRKGRDIYDISCVIDRDLNLTAVRKMVLYYFYRADKVFHYPTFISNVEQKLAEHAFGDDVRGLIRRGDVLDWPATCQRVLGYLVFLSELDDRDRLFLDLTKYLLRKPYPQAHEAAFRGLDHPLAWLMAGLPISAEARAITQADIQPYRPE